MSIKEIAKVLDISEYQVRKALEEGLRKLRFYSGADLKIYLEV